jgi:subtilisin family serine protease
MSYRTALEQRTFQLGGVVDTDWETLTCKEKWELIKNDRKRLKRIAAAFCVIVCVVAAFVPLSQLVVKVFSEILAARKSRVLPWGVEMRDIEYIGVYKTPLYVDKDIAAHLMELRDSAAGTNSEQPHEEWVIGLAKNITQESKDTLKRRLPDQGGRLENQDALGGGVAQIMVNATLDQIKAIVVDIEGIAYVDQDCGAELTPEFKSSEVARFYTNNGVSRTPEGLNSGIGAARGLADEVAEVYSKHVRRLQEDSGRRLGCHGKEKGHQAMPDWGIDRVDNRHATNYAYGCAPATLGSGEGVSVYVVDTGIRYSHRDFEGRAFPAVSWQSGSMEVCDPTDFNCGNDQDGHGTHCAAIVGGKLYGVAKKVTLHSVRVAGPDGSIRSSSMVQGISWVLAHGHRPAVVSMSLQMLGTWRPILEAINQATEQGVAVVVAAGNNGGTDYPDACDWSPAYVPSAITVAATSKGDLRFAASSWGSCVDIFAPGKNIKSASHLDDGGYTTKSGTSQAAPMVAGAVALLLGHDNSLNVKQLTSMLKEGATDDQLIFSAEAVRETTVNKFLYVGSGFGVEGHEDPYELLGQDRACRGRHETDGGFWQTFWSSYWGDSYYNVVHVDNIELCKTECSKVQSCTGIEFKRAGNIFGGSGRCEIWLRQIGSTAESEGFDCYVYSR